MVFDSSESADGSWVTNWSCHCSELLTCGKLPSGIWWALGSEPSRLPVVQGTCAFVLAHSLSAVTPAHNSSGGIMVSVLLKKKGSSVEAEMIVIKSWIWKSWALSPKNIKGVVRHLVLQPACGLSEGDAKSVPESIHHVHLTPRKHLPLFLIFLGIKIIPFTSNIHKHKPPHTFKPFLFNCKKGGNQWVSWAIKTQLYLLEIRRK